MAADALAVLLRVNLTLAAAVLFVLALRPMIRRVFGARVAYALWLAAPAAIFAIGLPPRPSAEVVVFSTMDRLPALAPAPDYSLPLLIVWTLGAAAMLAVFAARQRAFVVSLGSLTADPVQRGALRASAAGIGPAIVGAIRPRLVLPSDFEAIFDERERALVLSHEREHLRVGDAAMNGLIAMVQCLCWFNPLAHLGARCVRVDQELACDAAVIALHPREKRAYAAAMLKAQIPLRTLPIGCAWPARSPHPLKLRIALLKQSLPSRTRARIGAAVVMLMALTTASVSWAALPASRAPLTDLQPVTIEQVDPSVVESTVTVSSPLATGPPASPPPRRRRASGWTAVTSAVGGVTPAAAPAAVPLDIGPPSGAAEAPVAPLPGAISPAPPPGQRPPAANFIRFRPQQQP